MTHRPKAPRRPAVLASALVAGLGTLGLPLASASAQNLPCPGTTNEASIVELHCVGVGPQSGVLDSPCKPADNATMPADQRTVQVGICSKALGRVVRARVVLPREYYKTGSQERAPLLYLLHGANVTAALNSEHNYDDWTNNTELEERVTAETNTFVVTPEGGPIGWYSDWRVNPQLLLNWRWREYPQRWESHFFDEVMPLIEDRFFNNGQRVIAGLSMGGLGAISYAARAPLHGTSFRAAASFSGALSIKWYAFVPQGELLAKGLDPNLLWGNPNDAGSRWTQHDPRYLVDRLIDVPVWVASGNGVTSNGIDAIETGAWAMSTDYANAQQSANNRAKNNAAAQGSAPPKGYVVRDMGEQDPSTGMSAGCSGKHDWAAWRLQFERAWPFLRSHLTAENGSVPTAPEVLPCGQTPSSE